MEIGVHGFVATVSWYSVEISRDDNDGTRNIVLVFDSRKRKGKARREKRKANILGDFGKKLGLGPVDELGDLNLPCVETRLLQVSVDVPHLLAVEGGRGDEVSESSTLFEVLRASPGTNQVVVHVFQFLDWVRD